MTAGVNPPAVPGEVERKAEVYVLRDHLQGRPYRLAPTRNAADRDLEEIYFFDHLANYPDVRTRYEARAALEAERRRTNRAWALDAIDALYRGAPVPGRQRPRFVQVLRLLITAGPAGVTRKEVCRTYGVDGGKVSGALTTLHEAGVCFPLQGVKR